MNESGGQQKPEGASANNSNGKREEHPVIGNGGDAQVSFLLWTILFSMLVLGVYF